MVRIELAYGGFPLAVAAMLEFPLHLSSSGSKIWLNMIIVPIQRFQQFHLDLNLIGKSQCLRFAKRESRGALLANLILFVCWVKGVVSVEKVTRGRTGKRNPDQTPNLVLAGVNIEFP